MSANLTDTIKRVLSDETDVRAANAAYDREFPYERDDEAQVTRREFCGFLGLTSTALFAGAAGFAGKAVYDARRPENFAAAKIDGAAALEPNSALNFHYPTPREPALLIRAGDGNYYAYGQKCTHLSCPVYYSAEHARIECPCHEAGFETATGRVLYGPPPRALDRIELEIRNGEVWAVGKKVGGRDEANG